jgi:hypothetical protein
MSETTIIPILQGTTYKVYTSEEPIITSAGYTFSSDTNGYVIATDPLGKTDITVIGSAQKCVDVFNKRRIEFKPRGSRYTVNDFPVNCNGFTWLVSPDAFAAVSNGTVVIEMGTEGYYCVNYEALFHIKDLVMNLPIVVDVDESGQYSFTAPEGLKAIHYDGGIETLGNMFTQVGDKIFIDKKADMNELCYLETADGFIDVNLPELVPRTSFLPADLRGVINLLRGFRAATGHMPSVDKSKSSVKLDVERYNGQSTTLDIKLLWLEKIQHPLHKLVIEVKYPSQKSTIDFSRAEYSDVLDKINGEDLTVIEFTEWYTILPYTMKDGLSGEINVYREILPYETIENPTKYFKSGETLGTYISNGVYTINGVVYDASTNEEGFTTEFDGVNLSITARNGAMSFGLYDGEKVWSITPLRVEIVFNTEYRMAFMQPGEEEVDLAIFGNFDTKDKLTYQADGKDVKRGVFKVKVKDDLASGSEFKTVSFTAKSDDATYDFSVTFVYEEFNRTSFLIPGVKDFSSRYTRTVSFAGLTPFWMYGRFICQPNTTIHAYQSSVSEDSSVTNLFPIVKFSDRASATIMIGSVPVDARIITEPIIFPSEGGADFVRLNQCSDIVYKNKSYIVPKTIGVVFFRLNETIYLMRTQKDALPSSDEYTTTSLSRHGSFAKTALRPAIPKVCSTILEDAAPITTTVDIPSHETPIDMTLSAGVISPTDAIAWINESTFNIAAPTNTVVYVEPEVPSALPVDASVVTTVVTGETVSVVTTVPTDETVSVVTTVAPNSTARSNVIRGKNVITSRRMTVTPHVKAEEKSVDVETAASYDPCVVVSGTPVVAAVICASKSAEVEPVKTVVNRIVRGTAMLTKKVSRLHA